MLSGVPEPVIQEVKMFLHEEAKYRYKKNLDLDRFETFLVSVRPFISSLASI